MKRLIVGLGISLGAVVAALACSGKTTEVSGGDGGSSSGTSGTSGGTSGSSGGSSGSSGGLVSGCPASPPTGGDACKSAQLQCEYGTDTRPLCNTIATCDGSKWNVTPPQQAGCPTPPPGPSCPASYAAVPVGSTCTTAQSCTYPQGTCSCEIYCGPQGPVGRVCDAGTPLTWVCTGASNGCPAIRPHAGTACTQEQQFCSYGDCSEPAMRCVNGAWQLQQQGCPVSTRTKKQEIRYLDEADLQALTDRTLSTRLATYRYTSGDPSQHLGFIIEDDPESPAVMSDRGHVDLYAYSSMAVATLQMQGREIAELRREVDALKREIDASRKAPKK